MSYRIGSHWGSRHLVLVLALAVFGAAVLPPVLWLVNDPSLLAGYPILYLWAFLWGVIGTGLLYVVTDGGYFGIDSDEVPPELRDVETSVAVERTSEIATPSSGGDE